MNDEQSQLAGLVADLDSLAGLWQKAGTVTDPRYGPHDAGYDEALKLCARQLRAALAEALAGAGEAAHGQPGHRYDDKTCGDCAAIEVPF